MKLSRTEIVTELTISLPWLALSLFLAGRGLYALAAGASFIFFLTGLRQVHDAYHYNLGLSKPATEWIMYALSIVMLGSMHAVQLNHLRHHARCLEDDDVEAKSAHMSALGALCWGPMFPVQLHTAALRAAGVRQRRWIIGELATNLLSVIVVFFVLHVSIFRYHVVPWRSSTA